MSTDPRIALNQLVSALEEHLNAVAHRRGEQDAAVENAYLDVADAFEAYEDALYAAYDEVTPLEVVAEDLDDDEEEDDLLDDDEDDLEDEDLENLDEDLDDEDDEEAPGGPGRAV